MDSIKSEAQQAKQPVAANPKLTGPEAAPGPLVVSQTNPRYFTVASGKSGEAAGRQVLYLTGSHIWNNLQDGMGPGSDCTDTPEQFDYKAYVTLLRDHGHNFIRLWRWE